MPPPVPSRPGPRRLFVGAALGLAAAVALCSAAFSAYLSSARWMDRTLDLRQEWLTSLLDAETAAHHTIAAGALGSPAAYDAALATARTKASLLRDMVVDDPQELQNVGNAERDAQALIDEMTGLVTLAKAGHRDEALVRLAENGGLQRLDVFRADLRTIRDEEARRLEERRHRARSWGLAALFGSLVPAVAAFALLVLAWRREGLHDRMVTRLAADARLRLTALSDLAAALAEVRTRPEVARVVVDHGMRAAGADTCTLYQLDETGKALELLGRPRSRPGRAGKDPAHRRDQRQSSDLRHLQVRGVAHGPRTKPTTQKVYPALAAVKAEGRESQGLLEHASRRRRSTSRSSGRGLLRSADLLRRRACVRRHPRQAVRAGAPPRFAAGDEKTRRAGGSRTTLRSIGDAVIATDAEGRVTFMNPVAETLTGWTEADARGRSLDDVFCIFSEQTRAVGGEPRRPRCCAKGTIVGLANHTVLRSKRGEEVPIDDSGAPIRNEDGHILGVVLVFRDVTEEKRERARTRVPGQGRGGAGGLARLRLHARDGGSFRRSRRWPTGARSQLLEPGAQRLAAGRGRARGRAQGALRPRARRALPARPHGAHRRAGGHPHRALRALHRDPRPSSWKRGAVDAEHLRIIRELQLRLGDGGAAARPRSHLRRDDVRLRRVRAPLHRRTTSPSRRTSRGARRWPSRTPWR